MSFFRARIVAGCSVLTLLAACASEPTNDASGSSPEAGEDAELTLNLPQQPGADCACETSLGGSFFDRGVSALAVGDHVEAVTYFQRYQRTETSEVANWEAEIAIAYDSILPQSPFYDPQAARDSWRKLQDAQPEGVDNETSLIMRDALAAFDAMYQTIRELRSDNARLTEDLEKREEALRRLRELTLGQKGVTP
ncbi:MAG: hypothetical protein ACPG1A_05785 [Halioglobus sp.]